MYPGRLAYFIYYLAKTDRIKFRKFLQIAKIRSGKHVITILLDIFYSSLKYKISILDYFYFRFYELNREERGKWAGTGFMYEYQLKMNPKESRDILEDKISFLKHYSGFVKRDYSDLGHLEGDHNHASQLLQNLTGKLVLKGSKGQTGAEVEVINCKDYKVDSLLSLMRDKGYDLAEEYVVQHSSLMKLSPSGLNTLRIFTQLSGSETFFLGARLRISVNSQVDNMAAGNLAAPVDMETGIVCGPGVYSDIELDDRSIHPVTGVPIDGFILPFWKETLDMARQAATLYRGNKSIGWDIAITDEGPELIEGNHNWCKLLWQLPVKKGLKEELIKYL